MPRMDMNVFRLRPSKFRGLLTATFPYRPEDPFREALKLWPGVTYGPKVGLEPGVWLVPEELAGKAIDLAKEWGMSTSAPATLASGHDWEINPKLHWYQGDAAVVGLRRRAYMLNFEMGCIDGDAIVHVNYGGNGRQMPLREVYRRWQEWSKRPGYARIRSLCGEELHLNAIRDVRCTGVKPVVELKTEGGKVLRLTPDHEVLTPDGWVRAGALTRGRAVMTNGQWTDKDGYVRVGGLKHKHQRWTTGGVYEHILVAERMLGRKLKDDERVHHKNGVRHDNREANLEVLTAAEHMSHHGKNGGYHNLKRNYFVPKYDTVISVEPAGECEVYDVVCADPHRNFVANGIVVHNCGKTPTAIEVMRLAGVQSALVVCPALVRLNWRDELDKWWPEHGEVSVLDTGKKAETWALPGMQQGIGIVSYELLPRVLGGDSGPVALDAIVIDESHYIANNRAGRAKNVRALLDANRSAIHLALTATPVTNEPKGLWYQLDSLWPHRFGSWPAFMKRYAIVESNGYTDWHVHGLNEDNAEELRQRVAAVSSRVTKQEVAHLLPPFSVQMVRVPPKDRGFNPRALLERFTRMDQHRNNGEELIRATGEQKVESTVEQVMEALDSGTSHVCVLTHLNATAEEITAKFNAIPPKERRNVSAVLVDEENIPRRLDQIKKAKAAKSVVMVTTMHKVNVGIDLTAFPVAILAELDYTPANVIQALGRFSRLSGKVPSTVIMLVLSGTQDEIVAARVLAKVNDINSVIRAGQSEAAVAKALEIHQSDEDFFAELRKAALVQIEGDVYE